MRKIMLLLLFATLVLAVPGMAGADAAGFCSNLFTGGNVLHGGTSATNLLAISLLLMLIMLMIAGVLYAIGSVIKVDKLTRFAKSEMGEVIITLIIVFIFVGSFTVISVSTPSNFLSISKGTFSTGIYMYDCKALYSTSLGMVLPTFGLMGYEMVISLITSVSIQIQPVYFGIALKPFSGLLVANSVAKMMINIGAMFFGMLLATMFVLLIAYKLFPLFFFAGVVLRTIPWTRAAGGAFIGLFVGFFIVLPIMIYIFTSAFSVSSVSGSSTSLSSVLGTLTTASGSLQSDTALIQSEESSSSGIFIAFIRSVLEPSMFYVIGVVLSFIISYNFMEVLGDLLGAPSLSSGKTLKRLL